MIVVSGLIELASESLDNALDAARSMAAATREEAGCISYAFYTDIENPTRVRIFEEWESDEALAAHFRSPHMAVFRAALADVGVRSRDVKRYEVSQVVPM